MIVSTIDSTVIFCLFVWLCSIFHSATALPAAQTWSSPPQLQMQPTGYPDPRSCQGNCSWIHDPSLVYEDGTYWRFSTSGNIAIATAPRLDGPWSYLGPLLVNGTKIFVGKEQDIWAPSVSKFGDTWYCHYSVSYMGSQHSEIGVATSKSLAPGTWTDHGSIGLPQNEQYNLIDPHAFQDREQDPVYFTFGSYWTGIQQFIVQDHSQLIAIAGDLPQVNNIISNTTEHYAVQEGATMHKHGRDFYIFFSVGQCCRTRAELMPPGDEYHIVVCRAETVNGPYFDKERKNCGTENGGTTILASHGDIYAPGGQGVIMDEDTKKDVLYYHYVRKSVGYQADQFFFGYNYIEWEDGWPVVVN